MVVPVPLEVISMLQMFKNYPDKNTESERSPLLEMLMPHFEEIFDEIEVETIEYNESLKNTDNAKPAITPTIAASPVVLFQNIPRKNIAKTPGLI